MEKFKKVAGIAAPLDMQNVDTDMIIPKQFLKTITRENLGKALFYDLRFEPDGKEKPDFILNRKNYCDTKILIAGENFGCGSSREHAPWALRDFGIRVIIASRFADIFYNNCFQNALLPIILPEPEVQKLMEQAARGTNATFFVDLEKQEISAPDETISFEIEPERKKSLLEGRDAIAHTLEKSDAISEFEQKQLERQPWLQSSQANNFMANDSMANDSRAKNSPATSTAS